MSPLSVRCAGQEPLRRRLELQAAAARAEVEGASLVNDGYSAVHLYPHSAHGVSYRVSDIAYAPVLQPQHPVRYLPDALIVTDHDDSATCSRPRGRPTTAGDPLKPA